MIELLLQAERALSVGLLDRAETLYRQVARTDPRNSIAVVGLARVTLDRGDEVGALELARRALVIDPENAAAQRMVARLEEILDYRSAAELVDLGEPIVVAEPAASVGEPGGVAEPAAIVAEPAGVAEAESEAEPEPAAIVAEPAGVAEPATPAPATPRSSRWSWLTRLFRGSR